MGALDEAEVLGEVRARLGAIARGSLHLEVGDAGEGIGGLGRHLVEETQIVELQVAQPGAVLKQAVGHGHVGRADVAHVDGLQAAATAE